MELSRSKIKNLLYFRKWNPAPFSPSSKIEKKEAVETVKSFGTAKAVTKGNHRLCLNSKPQVQCQ